MLKLLHLLKNYIFFSDDQLKEIVQGIRCVTPNIGQSRLMGALRARGLCIQRERVRKALRELDPIGTALRWNSAIFRRKYSVPTPNALWHIDGNHKLIRYRMVVHVCVDGFSRLIIYAHCASNNKAETVLVQFLKGVNSYGLPSRVRSDHGLENLKVAQFMLEQRGSERGSMLTGSSVHNCRVERAHRDIYAGVLSFFAITFGELEDDGLLDPLNELHLFALHYTYLPRINASLSEFIEQWMHHGLRTENGSSPLQLYTEGILQNANSGHIATDSIYSEEELFYYGVDGQGPFSLEEQDYQVAVPETDIQLTENQVTQLSNECSPMADDGNAGKDIFVNCLSIITR